MRWIAGQCAILLAGILLAQGQATSAPSDQPAAAANQQPAANPEPDHGTAAVENVKSNHKWHVKLGTVSVSAGYASFPGPFFGPFYPYYGFFGPGLYYPGFFAWPDAFYRSYAPYYGTYLPSLAYGDDKGKVELAVRPESADVYLDGAYAGPAGNLKKMWLSPGAYDLTVSMPGGTPFHERIYVLSGKSLKIKHSLLPQNIQEKQ